MKYIIRNNDNGKYVAAPGSSNSYTTKLEKARTFNSREAAEADACGNERAIPVESLLS